MSINHKSIFAKVKEYKGNPLSEYNKIKKLLNKCCYYSDTIYTILYSYYSNCKLLTSTYVDFDDCLNTIINKLEEYKECSFEYLEEDIQSELFDDFLLFCEVIIYAHLISLEQLKKSGLWNNSYFKKEVFHQVIDLIKNSLNSMNHDVKVIDTNTYETVAYKCNPEAECVAEKSSDSLKEAIYLYLGTRKKAIDEKINRLHNIVDLIEPLLKKYSGECCVVSKVREYVQLLRHPETKKDEKQYQWFYEEKALYLDELFMLCIFVMEYDISKNTICEFENLKKNI